MYRLDIGVEIHVELHTKEKLFCGCRNRFERRANKNICPVCMGLPGALPSINNEAVELAVRAGAALGGKVQNESAFDRKNYFYVDNPKNYQITQFHRPIVKGGALEYYHGDHKKTVGITQIHIEEDAGKLIHKGEETLIDFNRAGVPLIEIVTEPDIHSKEECSAFLSDVRRILLWNGISDCKMEEGSIRFDLNVSIRREGEDLGQRIEVKNINSFKNVEKCIDYEYNRQSEIKNRGEPIQFETRRWDDKNEKSVSLRKKEEARDYRYIPDGDLRSVFISSEEIEHAIKEVKESPAERIDRLKEIYKMDMYNARIIAFDDEMYCFFRRTCQETSDYKGVCNYLLGEVAGVIKEENMSLNEGKLTGVQLAHIVDMKKRGDINNNGAKKLIKELFVKGGDVQDIIDRENLIQKSDAGEIETVITRVLQMNSEKVEEYKGGNQKIHGWLFGQVMKAMKGQGNPSVIKEVLEKKLHE